MIRLRRLNNNRRCALPDRAAWGALRAHLQYLDAIAVWISHEAQPRAAVAHGVRRLLRLDALLGQSLERRVEVAGGDRDVPVAAADLVGVDAEVVGELQAWHVAVA